MAGRGGGRHNHRNRPPPFQSPPQQQPPQQQLHHQQQQQFDPSFLLHTINQFQNPYTQNPNSPFQNLNFIPQNPNYAPNFPQNQNYLPPQNPNPSSSNSSQEHQHHLRPDGVITIRPHKPSQNKFQLPQSRKSNAVSEQRDKIEAAVVAARREMVAGGKEHVSSWKVSQAALVRLKADSWEALGFQMQEIPSLRQLLFTEGKINAFIHCHVAAHKITSLFELREALCKNEGVEKFEELELGPFLMQPLVIHYFSLSNGIDEVYEITAEKIVSHLALYLYHKPRDANIEELLDYIAKKCKVTSKEKLGVRIQSLGMHVSMICKARGAQNQILKKVTDNAKEQCSKRKKKRPLFSLQKKEFDERYSDITQRVSSFASVNKDFSGQHLRFNSSSSGEIDDVTESSDSEDNSTSKQNQSLIKSRRGDKVSSCPYPSVAEEISRLGLRGETGETSSPSDQISEPAKKKRKAKCQSHGKTVAQSSKRPLLLRPDSEIGGSKEPKIDDTSRDEDSIRMFITTWKEACRGDTAAEVFEKMLHVYTVKKGQKNTLRKAFSRYPFVGLLNVAVTSIRKGMWDSMYDTFQLMATLQQENTVDDELTNYENIDIGPTEKGPNIVEKGESVPALCVNVEDVLTKASEYLAGNVVLSGGSLLLDRVLMFVEQISCCELWLAQQFSVREFKMLGHGEFWSFLGKNRSLLPKELLNFLTGEVRENHAFEVSMFPQQLVMLLSQALGSLWGNDSVTKENLLELLTRQFPLISFKTSEGGGMEDLIDSVRQHSSLTSTCVIFSATLLGTSTYSDPVQNNKSEFFDSSELTTCNDHKGNYPTSLTSRDAIEVLLRAPFLSDLDSWSHWDSIYAPSLGPLMEWLLTEVNVKDLVCLVTRHGKIIRIDHSASGEMLFQALIQESPFQVAVQLLSLFTLSGGRRHVPLSLLKCQTRQGFEVIISNPVRNMGLGGDQWNENMFGRLDTSGCDSSMDLAENLIEGGRVLGPALRVVIDCLTFLPSEFRCFAADVLLSGLRALVKDVNSAVLVQCKGTEERLMLHEVGFGLGIIEWIDDHHALCPLTDNYSSVPVGDSSLISAGPDIKSSGCALISSSEPPFSADNRDGKSKHNSDKSPSLSIKPVNNNSEIAVSNQSSEQNISEEEAAVIIESIRREEFGLVSSLSDAENDMLKKQHARLGRALQCLSQELYSLDSHFLLELVQNADDNAYLENVEPTLCFILQDTSIIILNNEQGFTARNIRALCDVGNSTKKGSSAGYIGQKGIGFKSVFRITDAPEIHSNGFHIKFDISEGQIGFVLPTTIPPCDIQMFRRLASGGDGQKGMNCWNTCIVLPFKSKLREESGMCGISSMFLDLHPSLLLFLHRLRCIKVRNMANDSYGVMRKEVLGDGIVRVSNGEEKMTWFVASCKLCPKVNRLNAHMTEISIAFTLEETVNGDYKPVLAQQPVFAFLPLRAYGLKFILQADFILPSSREEVDGDNPWNQWLLSEFPSLFVSAEKLFCALPCFQENPAKAVNAYMSFVPLVGEVHGFFSGLPRLILSKLRQSNCLLQDGCMDKWVAPCKVLKGWNEQAEKLLPDTLLYGHLGLGLLHKDIHLSDALARALGVEEYGPKILVQFISSISRTTDGMKSMGLCWLVSYLSELHSMLHSHAMNLRNSWLDKEQELINSLTKVPFIPLSNGTFGSLDEGTIWFHADYRSASVNGDLCNFPCLYAKLRIVSPALFSASGDVTLLSNCSTMLQKIGVQEMSAHELIISHILPALGNFQLTNNNQLMIEYLTFVMLHLQSNCIDCHVENEHILSELRSKALILTNHGFKRPSDIPIHFCGKFGNFVDVSKFVHGLDYKWHEVDNIYLDHPATKSVSCGLTKWREFLQMLGVTDFVKLAVAEKSIADLSPVVLDQIMSGRHLISPGLVVRDWESPELVHILSLLSKDGSQERCRYMLEALDALWDDHFSDKVLGCSAANAGPDFVFETSLLRCICDTKWVVSSADNELHYPRDLFHDCDDVRSILGGHVPYAVPKIKSLKLLNQIGFKSQVTLDDVLSMLQTWSRSKSAFTASLSQMSKLYSFICNQIPILRQQAVDVLKSGPFIFVPGTPVKFHEDVVAGVLLSPEEVYWRDPTGALEHSNNTELSVTAISSPSSKTLCSIYSALHDFFVKECGVNEAPPLHHYLQILQQLSRNTLPHTSANTVFQILLKWSDGLNCGELSPDDLNSLKECLSQLEYTLLPALQDKWVSLHPSFGLVCWCDDDDLKKEFKHSDNIEFLNFGELTNIEKEMLQTKVAALLKKLGIRALSEVVTREAIYYGPSDSGSITLTIGSILQFAQLYMYNLHPEKYSQLKQSGFSVLHDLRVIVVQTLYYRNVIKQCECSSKKRSACKNLLQGNILYTTCTANSDENPDYHSVFKELSRLFFDGTPKLELANFLHMVNRELDLRDDIEEFILNSQNMSKPPVEDSVWSLSSPLSLLDNDEVPPGKRLSQDLNIPKSKKKSEHSSYPPAGWKTAPGFSYTRRNGIGTQAPTAEQSGSPGTNDENFQEGLLMENEITLTELDDDTVLEDDRVVEPGVALSRSLGYQPDHFYESPLLNMEAIANTSNIVVETICPEDGPSKSSRKNRQLLTPGAQRALLTGKQGELVAYEYFLRKVEDKTVKWVNQDKETGSPYDIVIGDDEDSLEYIEVKSSQFASKDWFEISRREWLFAEEMLDSFSIAHVILSDQKLSKIVVYKNPVELLKDEKLKLCLWAPKRYQEPSQ